LLNPFATWKASFVVRLRSCAIACTLKRTFALCKIFLEGTLFRTAYYVDFIIYFIPEFPIKTNYIAR